MASSFPRCAMDQRIMIPPPTNGIQMANRLARTRSPTRTLSAHPGPFTGTDISVIPSFRHVLTKDKREDLLRCEKAPRWVNTQRDRITRAAIDKAMTSRPLSHGVNVAMNDGAFRPTRTAMTRYGSQSRHYPARKKSIVNKKSNFFQNVTKHNIYATAKNVRTTF